MNAKDWLEVMKQASDFPKGMEKLIIKYGEMCAEEARRDERKKLQKLPENIDLFMVSAECQGWVFHLGMWIKEGYETRTTEQLYSYIKFDKN